MDLKNLNITVETLLKNPKAKAYLAKEFPTLINTPIVRLYKDMPLKDILKHAKGHIPDNKIQQIIVDLAKL